jgi:hypothetical protein
MFIFLLCYATTASAQTPSLNANAGATTISIANPASQTILGYRLGGQAANQNVWQKIVRIIAGDFDKNYMNLIVAQSATNSTYVDGSLVAVTNFIAIGSSGYFGAQLFMTNNGEHTVISSQPVGVEVYGWGSADAYGYFGGMTK